MLRQQRCGFVTDVADAKAEHQLVQIVALGVGNRRQQVVGTFGLEFVQCQHLLSSEGVQVGHGMHQSLVNELTGDCLSQPVNGHGGAGRKMDQIAQSLCRALRVDAAKGSLVLQMHYGSPTRGADLRHTVGNAAFPVAAHSDDLRDDVTRLAHLNSIPQPHIQLSNDVPVVQAGTGNTGSRQKDGVKYCGGGQHSGTAHGHLDVPHNTFLDLRRILEGDGPAGELVGAAQYAPVAQAVHLDDRAVNIIFQRSAQLSDGLDLLNGVLDAVEHAVPLQHRESQRLDIIQRFMVAGETAPFHLLQIEYEN